MIKKSNNEAPVLLKSAIYILQRGHVQEQYKYGHTLGHHSRNTFWFKPKITKAKLKMNRFSGVSGVCTYL